MYAFYIFYIYELFYVCHIEVRDVGDRIAFITICCQSKQTLDTVV